MSQLGLFGGGGSDDDGAPSPKRRSTRPTEVVEPVVDAPAAELAARLPRWLRFGTSSWTFPGWRGLVYAGAPSQAALVRSGLGAYAKHPLLRTVGIDRSHYAPLEAKDLTGYAEQLPLGFEAVSKVWDEITTVTFPKHPRYGARAGQPNPSFLDPVLFRDAVLEPYAAHFAQHAGPFVLEIPPLPDNVPVDARAFNERLDAFLTAAPTTFRYAVELRNRAFFTPRYVSILKAHGASHVFNYWSNMPGLGFQLAKVGPGPGAFTVVRLLLPPGTAYESQREKFAPFDRIVDAQPAMREDVVRIALAVEAQGGALFVLVNNKAEGCSPLTVRALAELLADRLGAGPG
jgi:uncharacterized protein YecE (DUF72 family)